MAAGAAVSVARVPVKNGAGLGVYGGYVCWEIGSGAPLVKGKAVGFHSCDNVLGGLLDCAMRSDIQGEEGGSLVRFVD